MSKLTPIPRYRWDYTTTADPEGTLVSFADYQTLRTELAQAQADLARVRNVCAEVYQAFGVAASDSGMWDTDAANKVLDNLSAALADQQIPHESVLPYPCQPRDYKQLEQQLAGCRAALEAIYMAWNHKPHDDSMSGFHAWFSAHIEKIEVLSEKKDAQDAGEVDSGCR